MAWWSLGVRTENTKLVEFVEREVEMIVQVRTSKLSSGLVKAEVSSSDWGSRNWPQIYPITKITGRWLKEERLLHTKKSPRLLGDVTAALTSNNHQKVGVKV